MDYKKLREAAYPALFELIIALWELIVEGRHEAVNEVQKKREEVKEQYPKPNACDKV